MPRRGQGEWFEDGLGFSCTRCGNCCTGPPGLVRFTPQESARMAGMLGLLPFEFERRYARVIDGRKVLAEVEREDGTFDCVFLERDADGRARCRVYEARPAQCRTWPFWPENLVSPRAWRAAASGCPGMDRGRRVPAAEIRSQRDRTPM